MRADRKILISVFLLLMLVVAIVPTAPVLAQDRVDLTLRLLPGDFNSRITPGQNNSMFLEVRNNGNTTINNIRFSYNAPEGWNVVYTPDRLSSLGPESTNTIDVNIIPVSNAGRGDYTINLIAEADETRTVTTAFLRVEGATSFWLWVGIGIAVLVIAGFIVVFLRLGRQ